jgi:small subunit ribosomal protein S17
MLARSLSAAVLRPSCACGSLRRAAAPGAAAPGAAPGRLLSPLGVRWGAPLGLRAPLSSVAVARLGPEEKAARSQARKDAEAAYKAQRKLEKRERYELAIAQPLLSDPRECRLSILDLPDYQNVKKSWKKGVVVSDKMDKSVKLLVERWGTAWNGKRVKLHTKYIAHDEENVCRVGDIVYISDSRPISKTKHAVVQFNAGNKYDLRDRDPDDPEIIEAAARAKVEAEERYEQYLALQEKRAAAPRHKRIRKRERRALFGY